MARFRNLLVHVYWKVDNEKLFHILQKNLGDFQRFEEFIRDHLRNL